VWERARYDWSAPGTVRITVLDSNAFAPGGSWTYQITPAGGGSRVGLRVERRGRTVKGRLLATLLRITGRPVFCGDLRKAPRRARCSLMAGRPRTPGARSRSEPCPSAASGVAPRIPRGIVHWHVYSAASSTGRLRARHPQGATFRRWLASDVAGYSGWISGRALQMPAASRSGWQKQCPRTHRRCAGTRHVAGVGRLGVVAGAVPSVQARESRRGALLPPLWRAVEYFVSRL
jgi:hypothetical protein